MLFESIMRQRLEPLGTSAAFVLASLEEEGALAKSLQHLLRAKPTAVLIASTTAPAGPNDAVGRAMLRAGCQFERFLAPVEPGNLLLLGYKDEIPVLSAPGCFRSAKPNVIDIILPRCWLDIMFRVGKSPAWGMVACWPNKHLPYHRR